ncbi:hypothetical protein IFM89_007851 [Coptis chinensis]|uniref:Uncharacterized protein n=1 Tax=Coptis chinensis TaxID=261450 RepID=A0A835GYD1_9MAGN|nr:hypothetical protein IFM89_007851 [Coptis chinensis]
MSRVRGPGSVFQNQNFDIPHEGLKKKIDSSILKTSQKKVGGGRKPLQDISNASSNRQKGTTTKKKGLNVAKEEFNIADERFLHDPKKRIAAQKAEIEQNLRDTVLFEHGLLQSDTSPKSEKPKAASTSSVQRYLDLESIPEVQVSGKSVWCPSPMQLDSPLPSASIYELPNLAMLREPEAGVTFQNQNLDFHHEGPASNKMTSSMFKDSQKKVSSGRKQLQDFSNCSSIHQEASTRMSNFSEDFNVAEEGFLHDHSMCIAAQKAQMEQDHYSAFLFDHGLLDSDISESSSNAKEAVEAALGSSRRFLELEPIPELQVCAEDDWCISPIQLDSPPFSPSLFEFPELVLKPDIDD